jgi:hypothetical protein
MQKKLDVACPSEILVTISFTTQHHAPEDSSLPKKLTAIVISYIICRMYGI